MQNALGVGTIVNRLNFGLEVGVSHPPSVCLSRYIINNVLVVKYTLVNFFTGPISQLSLGSLTATKIQTHEV